ncbi:LacI family DNA-binding transcriptional regulator [Clostridium gasigenes]|uniref:LacI family DNA-binding transcriptional regulator n=1 Tax=Clostridium gasigenes TaxID=94869 RepID=UPI001C0D6059|nr:LacI family DNA-binding transcriptional regulator [Clostridium gasigenes]MBU3108413.1 LacI family transcriptional regulator [Clostridium gasigenes]
MSKTTLLDIANYVSVSTTTVSMVLNNKRINVADSTRNKIFEAARELNYIPNALARSLSTKKSYTIGFVIPDIGNPFFAEMAKAIETEAEKQGYSMILCNTFNSGRKEEDYIKLLIGKLVDGVIISASGEKNKSIELLEGNDIPFVIADRHIYNEDNINGVFCDNMDGITLGVKYLIKKGYKNVAFVGADTKEISKNSRLEYFKEISKEYNIFNSQLIEEEEISLEGGIRATEKLINKNLPIDVIFYSSDVMAIGGMKCLLRSGYKIPGDIGILGYDNIGICSFIEPELTTIAQPIYNMGKESCNLLIDTINGKRKDKRVINLTPYLVDRKTIK